MKRFNITTHGYKYDKLIFSSIIVFIVLIAVYVAAQNNFNFDEANIYFICKKDNCMNPLQAKNEYGEYILKECKMQLRFLFFIPLYTTKDCRELCTYNWCDKKYLPAGEYGKKPKSMFLLMNLGKIAFIVVVLGFLANHYLLNKGKKIDIEIPITKNKRFNITDKIRRVKIEDDN